MPHVRVGRSPGGVLLVLVLLLAPAVAQQPPDWQSQIDQLRSLLEDTRAQLEESQKEIRQLRQQLESLKSGHAEGIQAPSPAPAADTSMFPTAASLAAQEALSAPQASESEIKEQQELMAAQLQDQAQAKVESASRYRVRLSGMLLMNAFSNRGGVDIQDLPMLALPPAAGQAGGSVGATLRQTLLGLEVFGPQVAGARASGDIEMDFFGGFPRTDYGVTAGVMRLRVARMSLEWPNLSIVAGQDVPFISPRSPTSYATVGEPALAWSGNLWVWTPQVRVERRWNVSEGSSFTLSGGVLDPLTEQIPPDAFARAAGAGESSRQPALATHLGWKSTLFGREIGIGAGTYYARQSYSFGRDINAWAFTADWLVPFGSRAEFSGEMFRGQALGGLGGGIWNSALFNGDPALASTKVIALATVGGWSQIKLHATPKLEFNLAGGTDNPLAHDLERFAHPLGTNFPPLARNQSWLLNGIYRPRSDLLLALEYRKLRTYLLPALKQRADQVNLAIGVSF